MDHYPSDQQPNQDPFISPQPYDADAPSYGPPGQPPDAYPPYTVYPMADAQPEPGTAETVQLGAYQQPDQPGYPLPMTGGAVNMGNTGNRGRGRNNGNPRTPSRRWLIVGGALLVVILIISGGIALAAAHAGSASATSAGTTNATPAAPTQGKSKPVIYTVTAINGTTISATKADGSSVTITTGPSTIFLEANQKVTLSAVTVGAHLHVAGKEKNGSIVAKKIEILLPHITGQVTAIHGTTITVQGKKKAYTVTVNATTKYFDAQTKAATTLSAIQVGERIEVQGIQNSDGSFTALRIAIGIANDAAISGAATPSPTSNS